MDGKDIAVFKQKRFIIRTFEFDILRHYLFENPYLKAVYILKDLGYKNDVGYQTFMYFNESELRQVFMFLIESLPNEGKQPAVSTVLPGNTNSLLMSSVKNKIAEELNSIWIPPCCNIQTQNSVGDFIHDTVSRPRKNSMHLSIEDIIGTLKVIEKDRYLKATDCTKTDNIESFEKDTDELRNNKAEQYKHRSLRELKEQSIVLRQKLDTMEAEKSIMNVEYTQAQKSCERVEAELRNVQNILNNIGITDLNPEGLINKSFDEVQTNIDMLHRKSEELTSRFFLLKLDMDKIKCDLPSSKSQRTTNKNILINLKETAKSMKEELDKKEEDKMQVIKKYEKVKGIKRSIYTKRILEIINNVDKQNVEIQKILEETRQLQKEINSLEGQLHRCFSIADETLFRNEPTDIICRPCWQRAERQYFRRQREVQEEPANDEPADAGEGVDAVPHSTATILPGYVRTSNTANACVFQHCVNTTRNRIPEKSEQSEWHLLAMQDNLIEEFNSVQIVSALRLLINCIRTEVLDFENYQLISHKEFHDWTGLTTDQFTDLLANTPSLNQRRNRKTILAALLAKLRTGDSNARLATIFRTSESTFARMLKTGREALMQDFVPIHLGFDHMTRENVAQRNLLIPESIFGNTDSPLEERKAITMVDGTYIYIQKSSNYFFQRKSYSSHKFRNLLKPFLFVCCDGHIIEVSGPHAATSSDAQIMQNIAQNETDHGDGLFQWFYRNGDIFILDRGFRDAVPTLEGNGYTVKMPETKLPGESQLTTEQANKSRLVTICRWVVEVVNGRFKRDFRLLRNVHINITLHYMFEYFRIAAALINAYHVLIVDNVNASVFLQIIRERIDMSNTLADLVHRHNLNRRRAQFQPMAADMAEFNDFPTLTEDELILFSLGIYQLKQARSYYGEHVQSDGAFIIELSSGVPLELIRELEGEDLWMIRGRIQSRHIQSKTYYVYIALDRAANGRQAIAHYYCTCNIGKRTIGCCSHTMCIVWYMGYARHNPYLTPPAISLDDVFVRLGDV